MAHGVAVSACVLAGPPQKEQAQRHDNEVRCGFGTKHPECQRRRSKRNQSYFGMRHVDTATTETVWAKHGLVTATPAV